VDQDGERGLVVVVVVVVVIRKRGGGEKISADYLTNDKILEKGVHEVVVYRYKRKDEKKRNNKMIKLVVGKNASVSTMSVASLQAPFPLY